jgi:hypothetical protein
VYVFFGPRPKLEANPQTLRAKPRNFSLLSSNGWWVKAKCLGEEKYVLCFGEKVSKSAFLVSVRQIFECKDLDGLDEKTERVLLKEFATSMQQSFENVPHPDSLRLHEEWHGDGFLSRTTFLEITNAMDVDRRQKMLKLFDIAIGRQ